MQKVEAFKTGSSALSLQRRFVYGPGLDEPLAAVDASNARTYQFTDGLGSVIGLANATGQVTERYAYTAFGMGVVAGPGTAAYRYAGRRFDDETGLYHNRARAYSPMLGRFLQADPIGTQGGINVYAYTGNDPLDGTDPSGNATQTQFSPFKAGIAFVSSIEPDAILNAAAVLDNGSAWQKAQFATGVATEIGLSNRQSFAGSLLFTKTPVSPSSTWNTSITSTRNKYVNVRTDVGAQEFQANLKASGYDIVNQTQNATIMSNGSARYTIYTRSSTGLPGAQYFGPNGSSVKFSLGGP